MYDFIEKTIVRQCSKNAEGIIHGMAEHRLEAIRNDIEINYTTQELGLDIAYLIQKIANQDALISEMLKAIQNRD